MAFGGFKTVELNAVGWGALAVVGLAVGAAATAATDAPAPSFIAAMAGAFVVARVADELRDRRRMQWVPIRDLEDPTDRLGRPGISVKTSKVADVDGRRVAYVAVRQRDVAEVERLAGLLQASRRGRRRWSKAHRAVYTLPDRRGR